MRIPCWHSRRRSGAPAPRPYDRPIGHGQIGSFVGIEETFHEVGLAAIFYRAEDQRLVYELCELIVRHYEPRHPLQIFDPRSKETLEDCWTESYEKVEQQETLEPIIRSLRDTHGLDPQRYIRDEFIWVRSAFPRSACGSRPERREYLNAEREGRAIPFSKDWRQRILTALEFYEEHMEAGGFTDPTGLSLRAHSYLEKLKEGGHPFSFRSILVDEDQDMGVLELEVVAALGSDGPDGLFLSGDSNQVVYPKLSGAHRAGIGVAQRRSFKKSYRNSREILEAATELIERHGAYTASEEEMSAAVKVVDPSLAVRRGSRPLLIECESEAHEIAFAAHYARQVQDRLGLEWPVCIVVCGCREDDEYGLLLVREYLEKCGLRTEMLHRDSRTSPGRAFVSSLETVKGFEFPFVLVIRCSERWMPDPGVPPSEWWREARRLYVAMTRAREELVITYAHSPSAFATAFDSRVIRRGAHEEMPDASIDRPARALQAETTARAPEMTAATGRCRDCGRPAMAGEWRCFTCDPRS